MRIFHIWGDQFAEVATLPETLPTPGYLWLSCARPEFENSVAAVQDALQRWTGGQLFDPHVTDLVNPQLPSNFDYTSRYDLLVFRRLATSTDETEKGQGAPGTKEATSEFIDTSPVGLAVFDSVLLSVHPADCAVGEFFANRLRQQTTARDARAGTRMPVSPADLALRMVNHMVDSYLDLRRMLTRQLDTLQTELFASRSEPFGWQRLLALRDGLHLLEDTCEDQRAAITEWIDAYDELPAEGDPTVLRERELLRVRARDVLEHIERVLTHVRRLEASAENAVQMHFSAQSNRTNEIMRTLTVLTAIFLPLNLVTGFFGMNFEGLPFIHSAKGFWGTLAFMLVVGGGLSLFFWRKRYLGRSR